MAIGVVATLKVQDGREKEFEALFRNLAGEVRAKEPGNRLYQVCRSRTDKTSYVVMELYESDEALKAHGQTAHFKAAGPKFVSLLADKPDIRFFETI